MASEPQQTRKLTLRVFCITEDADAVAESLRRWFEENECPLTHFSVETTVPTEDEERSILPSLDLDPTI